MTFLLAMLDPVRPTVEAGGRALKDRNSSVFHNVPTDLVYKVSGGQNLRAASPPSQHL